jgi:hypothetical protein
VLVRHRTQRAGSGDGIEPNKPVAGNSGIAFRLTNDNHWIGALEPQCPQRKHMKQAFIALIAIFFVPQAATARFTPSFTYAELLKISDLVLIIEHDSTKASEERDSLGGRGRITTAKVLTQIKGNFNDEKITIHHFFYPASPNSPNHVTFPSKAASTVALQIRTPSVRGTSYIQPIRQFLAFLKRQEDGTYIPVTPQFDSKLSFIPLGGHNNTLWTHNDSGISEQGEPPLEVRTFVEVTPAKLKAEPDGTGQSATHPESKPEGSDNPQPEEEDRSR